MDNLTALIITFLRPDYTKACIKTLREKYPDIKIIVADNGIEVEGDFDDEMSEFCSINDAEYHVMPYDSGVCYARNRLIEFAKTEYVLVGDDDFFYTQDAKVERMVKFLDSNKDFDLIGGRVNEGGEVKNYQGYFELNDDYIKINPVNLNGQFNFDEKSELFYKKVDLTFNFFVARRESIKDIPWDEKIKVAYEHSDWFISMKKAGRNVAFSTDPVVIHKPAINAKVPEEYRGFRNRQCDKERFYSKHNIAYMVDMAGRKAYGPGRDVIQKIDMCITTFMRPDLLERLLLSIVKYYPDANIYIADQNKKFFVKQYRELWDKLADAGLQNKPHAINLSYDCGLSYARNYLVDNTPNAYKLILEDDFIFTEKTKIEKMYKLLNIDNRVGVVGGCVTQAGQRVNFEHKYEIYGDILKQVSDDNIWQEFGGLRYKQTGCVFNFALFKKEVFDHVKWDVDLKVCEHNDFFLNWPEEFDILYVPEVKIGHEKNKDEEYKQFRGRTNEFMKIMMEKHDITEIRHINGFTYQLKNGTIITTRT